MKNTQVHKNLQKVFKFYSTQQSLLGKFPTFASIEQNTSTLSKGKFLKFCLDFGLGTEQEAIFQVFNKVSGYDKEINFPQFLNALQIFKGNEEEGKFYLRLGAYSLNDCMEKCKPFSKKNGNSLPQLPPLINSRRGLGGSLSTKNTGMSSNVTKEIFESFKARNCSNLPSAAVVIPLLNSRGGSYRSRYGGQVIKSRNWDEINKVDSRRFLSIYGDLALNDLITSNQSDDEDLEKFGY